MHTDTWRGETLFPADRVWSVVRSAMRPRIVVVIMAFLYSAVQIEQRMFASTPGTLVLMPAHVNPQP